VNTPAKDTLVMVALLLARVVYWVVKKIRDRGARVVVQQAS
jgi:hypothetical protein